MFVQSLFPVIVRMSLTASIAILIVFLMRFLLKKAPRICSYMLWSVVLFRLLCPVAVSAPFGIIGRQNRLLSFETSQMQNEVSLHDDSNSAKNDFSQDYISNDHDNVSASPAASGKESDSHSETALSDASSTVETSSPNPDEPVGQTIFDLASTEAGRLAANADLPSSILSHVWAAGLLLLVAVSVVQYLNLRRKLVGAVNLKDNIYQADHIDSPFVLGVIRPKIYLPSTLSESEFDYVLAHEKHHIYRGDPFFRMAAYAALLMHWFNPLVWTAFFASRKDMEISCDEAVLSRMGDGIRTRYSESLLKFAAGNRLPKGTPLAFGEDDTKARIKRVMSYKKPALWLTLVAVFLCCTTIFVLAFNSSARAGSDEDAAINPPDTLTDDSSGTEALQQTKSSDPSQTESLSGQSSAPDPAKATQSSQEGSSSPETPASSFNDEQPKEETILSWHADLDNDGTDEVICLNVSEIVPGDVAIPWIESADGTRICDLPEIGLPHMSWGTYALLDRDGRTFLFSYANNVSTGAGRIGYAIYTLENGKLEVTEQQGFDSYMLLGMGPIPNDVDSMIAAAEQVNELWSHSRLLFSTAEDLYGLYDENGQSIEPSSIMYFGEDRIIRYREEYDIIKKDLAERGLYDESMTLRTVLEVFNELCIGAYDHMLISDFIRTVNDKDVDRYISLFASNIQAEMNDFIENNGKENFFQEESRTLLSVAAVSSDYVNSHGKSFDDVYAHFDEITVYYVTEDVQFPENAGSGLRRSGEQTNLYILVTEDGQRKLYRISGTPELDAADLGLRF